MQPFEYFRLVENSARVRRNMRVQDAETSSSPIRIEVVRNFAIEPTHMLDVSTVENKGYLLSLCPLNQTQFLGRQHRSKVGAK